MNPIFISLGGPRKGDKCRALGVVLICSHQCTSFSVSRLSRLSRNSASGLKYMWPVIDSFAILIWMRSWSWFSIICTAVRIRWSVEVIPSLASLIWLNAQTMSFCKIQGLGWNEMVNEMKIKCKWGSYNFTFESLLPLCFIKFMLNFNVSFYSCSDSCCNLEETVAGHIGWGCFRLKKMAECLKVNNMLPCQGIIYIKTRLSKEFITMLPD